MFVVAHPEAATEIKMLEFNPLVSELIEKLQKTVQRGNERRHVENLAANVAVDADGHQRGARMCGAIKPPGSLDIDTKFILF